MEKGTELSVDELGGVQAGYNKPEHGVEASAKHPELFLDDRLASDMKFFDISGEQDGAYSAIEHTLNGDIDFGMAAIDPDTAVQMPQWIDETSEQEDTSALGGGRKRG